jgi:hypothetical protein
VALVAEVAELAALVLAELTVIVVVVEVYPPDKLDLILQTPLVQYIVLEPPLEVAGDLLLYALVSELGRGPPHGAVRARLLRPARQLERPAPLLACVAPPRHAPLLLLLSLTLVIRHVY